MTNDDLQRQLDAAVAAIRELDDDLAAGRLSAADHAELKLRSERQAAALLKRLRQRDGEPEATPIVKSGRRSVGPQLRGPVAMTFGGVLLVVLGVAVGVMLGRSSSDVSATTTGQAAMPSGSPASPTVAPELEAMAKDVEREDAPITRLLTFAHQALDQGQIPAAITAYKRVLLREPKNVEAITHIGVILYQGGHVDQALARLDEAIRIDPRYSHAHWDKAQILFNDKKDYAGAAGALEAFLALAATGGDADRARTMLADARRQSATAVR